MSEQKLLDIESKLERMHTALHRQEKEIESWRSKSARLPNWIRNGGVALFIGIFVQSMTAVWWASEITNTQQNLISDVQTNSEYRISSTERYNEIMIEITKTKIPVTIIGMKNSPGSSGFMLRSNWSILVIIDSLCNDEYNEGNNAGIIVKVAIVIENKNTKWEMIGLLENFNMIRYL